MPILGACSKGATALRRHADAFVQLVHLLNVTAESSAPAAAALASPSRREGPQLSSGPDGGPNGLRCLGLGVGLGLSGAAMCSEVLATVTALVAGNAASRARVAQDIGYDQILTVVLRQARTLTGSPGRCSWVQAQCGGRRLTQSKRGRVFIVGGCSARLRCRFVSNKTAHGRLGVLVLSLFL